MSNIRADQLPFKIAIPSRGRAYKMALHPLLSIANVFVDSEEEREEYIKVAAGIDKKAHAVHVASGSRSAPEARNIALDTLWDKDTKFIVLVDDSVEGVRRNMRLKTGKIVDQRYILTMMWRSYQTALDLGTALFGYEQSLHPRERTANRVVKLRVGFIDSGLVGIMDPDFRLDTNLRVHDDMDLSLQCVEKYGLFYKDSRYCLHKFHSFHHGEPGGNLRHRNSVAEERELLYLRRKWGSDIVKPYKGFRQSGLSVTLKYGE